MNAAAPNTTSSQQNAKTSGDAGAVGKRLQSELMSLMMSKVPGVSAFPEAENLLK